MQFRTQRKRIPWVFFLFAALCLAGSAFALDDELGSDAYILSHFHYANTARVNHMQRNPLPAEPRAKPCSAKVFPATPGQETKAYFSDASITFRPQDLHTGNQMPPELPSQKKEGIMTHLNYCRMVNTNSPSINPATGTKWCLMGRAGRYVVMSDIYQDTCGNYFRGFWETASVIESYVHGKPQFTSNEEHAVTTSLGRYDGMEEDPQFHGAYNAVPGPTGPVETKRFLFFISASEAEIAASNKVLDRRLSPNGKYFRCKDGSFSMEKKHCIE